MFDVAVVGSGPAGLAVASACARRGLETVVVAPDPEADWPNNYGLWVDEAEAFGLADTLAARWPKSRIRWSETEGALFERAYGRVDNRRLQGRWQSDLQNRRAARALRARSERTRTVLELDDGSEVAARVVVDAAGADSTLVERPAVRTEAAQIAYGVEVEARAHGFPVDEMLLMDFTAPGGGAGDGLVTFLYAMPSGPDRVFVEETVLVGRPAPTVDALRPLLEARLERRGVRVSRVFETERCVIPMGRPLPAGPQRVVPFGASAAMIHPASGYSLNRTIAWAPALAEALEGGIRHDPEAADVVAGLGWESVWPRGRRQRWEVYRFGMEVLLGLDRATTQAFFAAFFSMPAPLWQGYLSGQADGAGVAAAMAQVFSRAPNSVRRAILRRSLGSNGLEFLGRLAR